MNNIFPLQVSWCGFESLMNAPGIGQITSSIKLRNAIMLILHCGFSIMFFSLMASNVFAGQMDGEWYSISRVRGGEQQSGAPTHAVIKDGKFNTMRDGKIVELGKIVENTETNPSRYSVEMTGEVEDAGKTFHGIFSMSGDTMLTCVNPSPDGLPPKEFKSSKDNATIFVVWQRVRKSPAMETQLDQVFIFLRNNAVNRTLVMDKEGILAEGRVGYKFRREATLCNLLRKEQGFSYDVIYLIKQSKWDILKDNSKSEPSNQDRILVVRYELGFKKSTGELIGHTELITSTRSNWSGSTDAIQMKMEAGHLLVDVRTTPYEDFFDKGDTFYPGSTDEHQIWQIKDGKLVIESRSKVFRINAETLDRELIEDRSEPTIVKELTKIPLK